MPPDPNMQPSIRLMGIDGPVELSGRTIGVSLPCPVCGYDLRGAPATGQCAECGCQVCDVLASAIDPPAHRMPPLADPRAVGDGLVLISLGLAAGVILPMIGMLCAGAFSQSSRPLLGSSLVQYTMSIAAIAVLALGLLGCWRLRPRHKGPLQRAARKAIAMVGLGMLLLGAGLLALVLQDAMVALSGTVAAGGGVLLSLGGVRGVLVEAGRRCRLFRTATFKRQRIPTLMLAGALAVSCLSGARVARLVDVTAADLMLWLNVLGLTMTLTLAVGLMYLVTNAMWIRRDLRQPPPRLAELLGE